MNEYKINCRKRILNSSFGPLVLIISCELFILFEEICDLALNNLVPSIISINCLAVNLSSGSFKRVLFITNF
jgi:hypothetical protein